MPDDDAPAVADLAATQERCPRLVNASRGHMVCFAQGSRYEPRPAQDGQLEMTAPPGSDVRARGPGGCCSRPSWSRLGPRAEGFPLALASIVLRWPTPVALPEGPGLARSGLLPEVGWCPGALRDVALHAPPLGGPPPS